MSRRPVLLISLVTTVLIVLLSMLHTRLLSLSVPNISRDLFTNVSPQHPPTMVQQNVVIVVGSGLAGLAASHEALRAGARVKLLDRAAKPGGNSIKASSGINGAGTRFQKERGIASDLSFYDDSVRSAGRRFKEQEGQAASEGKVDRGALLQLLVEESRGAVEWLVDDMGVDLGVVTSLGGHSVARTHRGSGKLPPGAALVSAFLAALKENPGFQLLSGAEVTALTSADGAVSGVGYTLEGQPHSLVGPVVFATGGFAGDAKGQLAEYRPDLEGMPATAETRPGMHGLLTAAGAALVDMDSVQIHPTGFVDPAAPHALTKFLAAEMLRGEGGIMLDSEGKRFVNELERRDVVSEKMMAMTPVVGEDGVKQWDATILLDSGASEAAATHLGFYAFKGLMQKKKVGELSESILRSVDEYADMVAGAKADPFGRRDFGRWKLKPGQDNRDEEVYVGKITPVVHFTMGGVAFDTKARVLGEDGTPIGGLYAAGEVTGGLHGDNRLGGSSLLECVVYGRIAGREAAGALPTQD